MILRVSAGALTAAVADIRRRSPPASAGFFERMFGGFRHAVEEPAGLPPMFSAYADPSGRVTRNSTRAESGPASAYCVRISDGFHFPVQAHAGVSAAESLPCVLSGQRDQALFRRQYRQRRRPRRQPLCRSRHRLPLSQATGRRLHLQWPRRIRTGARRRDHRSDAAAGRHRRDQDRTGGCSPGSRTKSRNSRRSTATVPSRRAPATNSRP